MKIPYASNNATENKDVSADTQSRIGWTLGGDARPGARTYLETTRTCILYARESDSSQVAKLQGALAVLVFTINPQSFDYKRAARVNVQQTRGGYVVNAGGLGEPIFSLEGNFGWIAKAPPPRESLAADAGKVLQDLVQVLPSPPSERIDGWAMWHRLNRLVRSYVEENVDRVLRGDPLLELVWYDPLHGDTAAGLKWVVEPDELPELKHEAKSQALMNYRLTMRGVYDPTLPRGVAERFKLTPAAAPSVRRASSTTANTVAAIGNIGVPSNPNTAANAGNNNTPQGPRPQPVAAPKPAQVPDFGEDFWNQPYYPGARAFYTFKTYLSRLAALGGAGAEAATKFNGYLTELKKVLPNSSNTGGIQPVPFARFSEQEINLFIYFREIAYSWGAERAINGNSRVDLLGYRNGKHAKLVNVVRPYSQGSVGFLPGLDKSADNADTIVASGLSGLRQKEADAERVKDNKKLLEARKRIVVALYDEYFLGEGSSVLDYMYGNLSQGRWFHAGLQERSERIAGSQGLSGIYASTFRRFR